MKKAVFYEEAKRRYVDDGLSIDTIEKMFKGEVTRRTLFNWKTDNDWDAERRKRMQFSLSIKEQLIEVTKSVIAEALANPTPSRMFAVQAAINTLKSLSVAELSPEKEQKLSAISKDTIDKIAELIGTA